MKKYKHHKDLEIETIVNQLWQGFNILKVGRSVQDLSVYLYLLSAFYDGVIDTEIEEPDKIDFMKYDKIDYSKDKYQIIINEINKLSLKQLKDKCVELLLKKSGSKPFLIERILIHELNLNYLVS